MTKRGKLRQKIEQNPKNVSFEDLRQLLELYGFELKRTKGSHSSFVGKAAGKKVLLVVPHHKPLKAVYVKKALKFIERIEGNDDEQIP
ncbi:MAG: type II toxin-antitoxin system HicA family toxin [Anaerolineae bacterium]|nr:type II toxin-antitoxin system HicA family toxin [Anaerolineae bacterium]